MKKRHSLSILLCLLSLGLSRAGFAEDHAQAMLLADVSAIQPGAAFTVGIRFKIDPGFHIYWKNPGDSGLPTDVKLTLPDGFTAGELMFPVPSRIELPGPIINYGYEDEVMLMVRITPPKTLAAGATVKIAAKVSWLVCDKDNCNPGGTSLSVEIPVSDTATAANADLFKQWTAALPVSEDSADIASTSNAIAVASGDGEASLNITWKKTPGDAQFIPAALTTGEVQNIQLTTTGDTTKITFTVKRMKGDEPVTGLLTFTSASGTKTGVQISIPVAGAGK